MTAGAFLLVAGAALLHAGWNVLLARADDVEAATAAAFVFGSLAVVPFALLTWRVSLAAVPWMAASAALELAYLVALARGYRSGRVAVVYPVARGTGPVVVLLVSVVFLGAAVGATTALGVAAIVAGVVLLRTLRVQVPAEEERGLRTSSAELLAGVLVGSCIAGYTLVDAEGLDHAAPLPYLLVVIGLPAVLYAAGLARLRGAAVLRAQLRPAVAGAGLASVGAYGLILVALTRAPTSAVAALRESSVVIAVVLAARLDRRRLRAPELGGALVIAAGVAAVVLG